MDRAAHDEAMMNLVRNHRAVPGSIEIFGHKQVAGHAVLVARWTDERTRLVRRGAVDVSVHDGAWVGDGGWSMSADQDFRHPVWAAWGGTMHSTSGWVSDPGAAEVRLRAPDGRVESATVENGVAILIYEDVFHRDSAVELLDAEGAVRGTGPLYGRVR